MSISAEASLSEILRILNSPSMKSDTIEKDGITTWTIRRKNKLNTIIQYNSHLEQWSISVPNGPFTNYFDILKLPYSHLLFIDGIPIKNLSLEEYHSRKEFFIISIDYEKGLITFSGKDISKFIVYGYLFPKTIFPKTKSP